MKIQLPLVRNGTYQVTESCGCIILEGKYVGIMTESPHSEEVLIFESVDISNGNKYFGAQWRSHLDNIENPFLYLISTHYGKTPDELTPVGGPIGYKKIVLFT